MALNGKFGDVDCLPVTGKDGKTIWIFKLEDLREVVPDDVYKCIEAFLNVEAETKLNEWLRDKEKINEAVEDGYLQMCLNTRNELGELLQKLKTAPRLNKKELITTLGYIYKDLNNNL